MFISVALVEDPWLAYSQGKNGGYCIPCRLFVLESNRYRTTTDPAILVQAPLTQFSKALEVLRKHSANQIAVV